MTTGSKLKDGEKNHREEKNNNKSNTLVTEWGREGKQQQLDIGRKNME